MTRLAVLFALLALLLSAGYLAVDRQLTQLVRDELQTTALHELLDFGSLHIEPFEYAVLTEISLHDPVSGERVAHVDELFIDLAMEWEWDGSTSFGVTGLRGRGGQALLSWDGEDLILARAIGALIERIEASLPPGDPDAPPLPTPTMTFDDLDVLVHAEGEALDRFPRTNVRVLDNGHNTLLRVQTGDAARGVRRAGRRSLLIAAGGLEEGEAHIEFGYTGGIDRVEARGFPISPALVRLEPENGEQLGRELAPHGLLDLVVVMGADGLPVVTGTLRDAQLSIPLLGFDLHPKSIPFAVSGGVGTVDKAEVDFAGGTAIVSLHDRAGALALTLDVRDANFREEFLELLPSYRTTRELRCRDGGRFELQLSMLFEEGHTLPKVEGRGGFHILDVRFGTELGELHFDSVVGSFEATEDQLIFPEVSGRLASGIVAGNCTISGALNDFDLELRVEDVDIGELHREMAANGHAIHNIAGWLQGSLRLRGTAGVPETFGGDARFSVRAGSLWDTPLLEAILLALPLKSRQPSGRHSAEASLSLFPDRISVDAMRLVSDLFTLEGTGSVGWDGHLDLQMVPAVPLGLLGRLLEAIQRSLLVNLRVEGTLERPRVLAIPFDMVTSPVRSAVRMLLGEPDEADPEDSH
ncbi:MAG: hypothetical protein DHS20C15_11300 [Planctomycetota bacterium]|nr:MAG: hypothetical protein DHS20C15_11300 [Planctomycetota bacterium]